MKSWYRSKTLWVNLLVGVLAAVESQFNLLQPLLPVNFYAALAFALPVINAALRLITKEALATWGQP